MDNQFTLTDEEAEAFAAAITAEEQRFKEHLADADREFVAKNGRQPKTQAEKAAVYYLARAKVLSTAHNTFSENKS